MSAVAGNAHLDQRAVRDHHVQVRALPVARDAGQQLPALVRIRDHACGGRDVGLAEEPPQVQRHPGVCGKVAEPGPRTSRPGHATDHDAAVEVVHEDLDPPRLAGTASRGRDVDGLVVVERVAYGLVHAGLRGAVRGGG